MRQHDRLGAALGSASEQSERAVAVGREVVAAGGLSKSLEVLIPMLYLKGVSTGDFEEALLALLGKDAGGLSASTIGRLKEVY